MDKELEMTIEEEIAKLGIGINNLDIEQANNKSKKEEGKVMLEEGKTKTLEEDITEMIEENEKKEEKNMMENKEVELKKATLSQVHKVIDKKPVVVAKYPYINEDGEVIYEIHRMKNAEEPFYVARPQEDGKDKYGLGKVKTIPYNLPSVLKAKEEEQVIIVTEGESKADVFNELGFTATTAPFKGIDKWNSKYNKYVKYAKVLVISDNDDKGREFGSLTFETISDVTDNIGILELAEIYPNLKEGGDIEDLRQIVGNDEQLKEVLNQIIEDFTKTEEDTKEVE